MLLRDLDERGFVSGVLGRFAATARQGQFDDAVIIDLADLTGLSSAPLLVYSVDQPSFVSPPDPRTDPFRFYGRWIAGVTCNDVIAMGARCRGFSLALAAPPELDVDRVGSLLIGITDVLTLCGAEYQGGNFDCATLGAVGVAWGTVPRHGVIRRSGAAPGELIVVTGELGRGWLEYQVRQNQLQDRISPADLEEFRHYKDLPVGAAKAIAAVAEQGLFTSGMDLSDGLVDFLYTLVSSSGVGCVIDLTALPVSAVTRRNLPALLPLVPDAADILGRYPELIALEPGYDSPLRHGFTIAPGDLGPARRLCAAYGTDLRVIGQVATEPRVYLDRGDGDLAEIPRFWDDQLRQQDTLTAWTGFLGELGQP